MVQRAVYACENHNVIIVDVLFLVGEFEKRLINLVEFLEGGIDAECRQPAFEGGASAACGQNDGIVVYSHIVGIDDFIGLHILQHTVLVYARRVRERVAANDGFVGLHRHIHQARHESACGINLLRVDVAVDVNIVVAFDNHRYFLESGVAGALADAVDRHFHLACSVEHSAHRVGGCHAEVVVAVG